ncbi:ABATE domain-containing protein [Asanoa sp. NPDC049518]|uniref:CGNR zinc finger domain-containing protein n=1 Tax=unclassified Asanoa TaxID=2685164 RepID=UPI0034278EE1
METVERMRLVGGTIALDFVNTRSGPPTGPPDDDVLTSYSELVAWAAYAGILSEAEAEAARTAHHDQAVEQAALDRAVRTRDYLDDLFRSLATGSTPSTEALTRLRDDEAEAIARARLDRDFTWTWRDDSSLDRPLWPVVHAAVDLLTAGPRDRVKGCGGCRFLFVDESKNRSRRWCSMEDCGTAEKMRRYVAVRRTRATRG